MKEVEVAEKSRVSLAVLTPAQREASADRTRHLTYLLAVKPDLGDKVVSANRIYRFEVR
jgi:hypothetical protein